MAAENTNVTLLLRQWRQGDRAVEEKLFEIVMPELRRIAAQSMARERRDHTLQAGDLIGPAYARLTSARQTDWQDRRHFYALAALAMRRFLIDYARRRGEGTRVDPDELDRFVRPGFDMETALAVDALMDELEREHPELASVVDFKFYLDFTNRETAEIMGISERQVSRLWHSARLWLFDRIHRESVRAASA